MISEILRYLTMQTTVRHDARNVTSQPQLSN